MRLSEGNCALSQLFEKMRKRVAQEMDELDNKYQSEVEALREENNVVCGVGKKLYTMKNISLLKKKIKNGEKIPENKVFANKIEDLCQKMEILVS